MNDNRHPYSSKATMLQQLCRIPKLSDPALLLYACKSLLLNSWLFVCEHTESLLKLERVRARKFPELNHRLMELVVGESEIHARIQDRMDI